MIVIHLLVVAGLLLGASCSGGQPRDAGKLRSARRARHRVAERRKSIHVDDAAVASPSGTPAVGRTRPMHLRMTRPAVCRAWRPQAQRAAEATALSPNLLLAIAWVESDFVSDARSTAGARGPMQLMPRTARAFGCYQAERPACAFPAGAALLRRLLSRFHGRMVYALCAYNAGAGRISSAWRANALPFNVWYAERVLAAKARLERHGCRGRP